MGGRIFLWLALLLRVVAWADDAPGDTPAGHSVHGDTFDEGPRQGAYLMEGMPKVSFPITTTPEAQKFFNQGVGQLHGFWYFEAERSFRQVAAIDTNCAMAYWGMAMANTYNEKRARQFIERAIKMTNDIPRRERLWIESLTKFYLGTRGASSRSGTNSPANNATDSERHRQYVRSLEQIIEEFPEEIEAKAFLTFKIWENAGRAKISSHVATDALAREVLAANPMHPIHHARIHFWNGEVDRRALDSAARCGQSAPGIAHMWHMPGHTYSSLHRYSDAAWQQEASARVDHAYMIRNQVLPDQIHNYAHNNEWLVRNLNHLGRVREALDLARNMVELPRHPKFNALTAEPDGTNNPAAAPTDSTVTANLRRQNSARYGRTRLIETLLRWELWDETIRLADTMYLESTDMPEEQVRRAHLLGIAYFSKGDLRRGEEQINELNNVLKTQKRLRQEAAERAENKAKSENKSDEQVLKAMSDALQSYASRIKASENQLGELRLFEALANQRFDAARTELGRLKSLPKERSAQIHLHLGETNKAEKLAQEAVAGATNQVQPFANLIDILNRTGKRAEAEKHFHTFRRLAGAADLDAPVIRRIQSIGKALDLPEDWRSPESVSADVGKRPALDSLGPVRWHPFTAPDWQLPGVKGKPIALKDFQGRPVLVIFYLGHGCIHCLEQLNAFAPAAADYSDAGISIVAVSTDSVEGLHKTFEKSNSGNGFPFPIVSDSELKAFKAYRAYDDFEATPLHGTFLIDGSGLVRWQDISYEPFTAPEFLLKEAKRLLKLPGKTEVVKASRPSERKGAELLRRTP